MEKSIDSIYNQYFHDIYRFLLSLSKDHYTAEDLVQETFFRAHLNIEHYDGETVKSWLFSVAYRAYIDYYRKHKRTVVKEQGFFATLFDKKKLLLDSLVTKEEIEEIVTLLDSLPDKHKYAVLLHDFHGLTQREAAAVMDIQQSHFKVLLFRGRSAIRRRKAGENE
ncbi:sigma-70 family RNA polymerase sigma factor [Aquibacillus koreensis]|uniref:Sigma-70 family RNA polymerase sigma factor n=1 Tax=Aquibacillus koreensis TaxID=279446 RepID=A0A9X3WH08_9BACI|nr:sigma-70 family RNA polymerase sigma factor [Aquibacillus koreensis]MCT2534804.1 sigma-70 family RNA polymerase sigma factor [Aquibacillus koreensis]MDC3419585.1 sigma-70 family RNA polymerase sigma factor [Aquibacillus koreensis]